MTSTTKAAHTPGAMRAARSLIALNETTIFSPGTTVRIAEIIDRETGATELLEALEQILHISAGLGKLESEDDMHWHDRLAEELFDIDRIAKAAIAKVRGAQ